MKARFLGGARDGVEIELEHEYTTLRIPYKPNGFITEIEQYDLDHHLADGTLVYGCIGTVETLVAIDN